MTTLRWLMMVLAAASAQAANLASDNASDATYNDGWTTGDNGGSGFGAWTVATSTVPDGAAGTFGATTSGNADLNNIAVSDEAWGLYANESGTGGNHVQIVGAVRDLTGGALSVGQSIVISMENGGIQGGSLSANVDPTRPGGWVGFVFNPAPQQFPDPINAFAQTTGIFAFGFQGGAANYKVYDLSSPSGNIDTGIPFTSAGLTATFTLTSASDYTLQVQTLGGGGSAYTVNGQISGSITSIGVFNRNAEEDNAYFNSMAVVPEPSTLALGGLAALLIGAARLRRLQ